MDMKSKLQMLAASFLMTASALWLTSCSSDDVVQGGTSKADLTLTLKINTGNVGSRATAWDGANTPSSTQENTINRLTVGIFDSNTKSVKTIVELIPGQDNGNTLSADGKTAKVVTTSLKNGDDILVAANAPAGNFAGVSNETDFNARSEAFEDAVTKDKDASVIDATKENNTNIPMYGSSTLSSIDASDFTAAVSVQHQLAKVTLESLSVDFKADGPYKDATFTPTEFFVVNAPTSLTFSNVAVDASANFLHGLNVASYPDNNITVPTNWGAYKDFLTTGDLSASSTELKGLIGGGNEKYSSKEFFYVTPSSKVKTDGNNMKLIIAGLFKANGTGTGEKVFYPVNLNATYDQNGNATAADNGTTYAISPNKNYKCTVVIRTKGLSDPTQGDLDPQTAAITVTVADFVDVNQSTTFE